MVYWRLHPCQNQECSRIVHVCKAGQMARVEVTCNDIIPSFFVPCNIYRSMNSGGQRSYVNFTVWKEGGSVNDTTRTSLVPRPSCCTFPRSRCTWARKSWACVRLECYTSSPHPSYPKIILLQSIWHKKKLTYKFTSEFWTSVLCLWYSFHNKLDSFTVKLSRHFW
jgi:hypothetical protein